MVNPFSTKFWASGVIPFQFSEPGESIDALLDKARQHPVCQIVGPHGSGKSTLLLELRKQYEASGENIRYLFFNDQHRHIPDDIYRYRTSSKTGRFRDETTSSCRTPLRGRGIIPLLWRGRGGLFQNDPIVARYGMTFRENLTLFVDGFEQLSLFNRFRLLFWSKRRSTRLILTVHRPVWFIPTLYRTKPQFSVFVQLVRQMTPNPPEESILRAVYEHSGGNFRDAFFKLYDMFAEPVG